MNRTWILLAVAPLAMADDVSWPPQLPGDKPMLVVDGNELLKPAGNLREGVTVAKRPPRVTFHYYDCQSYEGKPWSVWGDGLVADGRYYSSVGDHRSPEGNAFVYEFDPAKQQLKRLVNVRDVLKQPKGWYTPGKIHSQLALGKDGWLYFSTHRGSTKVAHNPENHFTGDWILRTHPPSGETEVVVHAPLKMQCLPTGTLDRERMVWYAGTADGLNEREPQFLAYDVVGRKVLYADARGPYRAMIMARSTGRMYFHGGAPSKGNARSSEAELYRFDPANPGKPVPTGTRAGLRAASAETAQGVVYTIDRDALWAFDVKTEKATPLGPAAVASKDYTTNLDVDPTGRFLYYIPGAHGGAEQDGTPVVQYDTKRRTRKVLCFLHPALRDKTGYIPIGSFGSALSEDGSILFVTWNGAHDVAMIGPRVPFRSVAMTVIEIPKSERVAN